MALAKIQAHLPRVTSPVAANDDIKPKGCRWSFVLAVLSKQFPEMVGPAWRCRSAGWSAQAFVDFLAERAEEKWPDAMGVSDVRR